MGLLAVGAAVGGPLAHRGGPAARAGPRAGQGDAVRGRRADPRRRRAPPGSRTCAGCWPAARRSRCRSSLAVAALLGFPPFALFFTEVAIVVAGWQAGLGWAMAVVLVLLLVVFAGLARATAAMVLGPADEASQRPRRVPTRRRGRACRSCWRSPRRRWWASPRCRSARIARAVGGGGRMTAYLTAPTGRSSGTPSPGGAHRPLLAGGHRWRWSRATRTRIRIPLVYAFAAPGAPRSELVVRVPRDARACRPWPRSPARRAASSARSATCYGVDPRATRCRDGWCGTGTGRRLVPHAPDAGPSPGSARRGLVPLPHVEGAGVYEIPVGPVHAGLIEPGHFRFSVVGETILRMKARLWFVHRGVEKLFEGRSPAEGSRWPSGSAATPPWVTHSRTHGRRAGDRRPRGRGARASRPCCWSWSGSQPRRRPRGHPQRHRLRDRPRPHPTAPRELLRHHARLTGHRLLRGDDHLGGAVLGASATATALWSPPRSPSSSTSPRQLRVATGSPARRCWPRGRRDMGVLGYVARARARHRRPARPPVRRPGPGARVVTRTGRRAREYAVRAAEVAVSARLVVDLARSAPRRVGTLTAGAVPPGRRRGVATGLRRRGWRGTAATVSSWRAGRLTRVKVVDPSFFNWPALPVALADTIVPDFPLANKSFNQSYAGNDL